MEKLDTSDTRTETAVVVHHINKKLTTLLLRNNDFRLLIVPLATFAKQPAEGIHAFRWILLTQRRYCLAPPFFKIEMPSSFSAISISFSKARVRIF